MRVTPGDRGARIGLVLLSIAAAGELACRQRPSAPPIVPGDMAWVTTSDDPLQWRAAGFLELTTPVRPPTTTDGTAHIVVVLRAPDGERFTTRGAAPLALEPPIGTAVARVEYAGAAHAADAAVDASWRVLDVRRFDWTADGVDCTVLRPDGDDHLVGLRWRCGVASDARAGELLAGYVEGGWFAGPRSRAGRDHAAHRIRLVNNCRDCHQLDRPEDRSPTALVQRSTDGAGMFSLRSVFRDEDPVERYRPVDPNLGDPTMAPVCPGSEIDVAAARCRDGLRPRLRVDVAQGVRDRAPHVLQLCETRRRLAQLLDPAGQAAVQSALAACAPPAD
jgi:hypothetical protein